jgi:hypothetical protein
MRSSTPRAADSTYARELLSRAAEELDTLLFPEFFKTELRNLPENVRHIVRVER